MYNVLDGLDLTMIELIEYFLGLFAYFNGVGKGIAILNSRNKEVLLSSKHLRNDRK